jgi:hypothetical protein
MIAGATCITMKKSFPEIYAKQYIKLVCLHQILSRPEICIISDFLIVGENQTQRERELF